MNSLRSILFRIAFVLFSGVLCCLACEKAKDAQTKAAFEAEGVPENWGSLRLSNQRPLSIEAKLANAAARRLNEAAQLRELLTGLDAEVEDGVVSVPIKMLVNDHDQHNQPFGDGQINASVAWTGWPKENQDAPLALTLAQVHALPLLIVEPSLAMVQLTLGDAPAAIGAEISDDQQNALIFSLKKDAQRDVYRAVLPLAQTPKAILGTANYPADVTQGPAWLKTLSDRWAWPRVKVRFFIGSRPTDSRYWPVLFRFPAQPKDDAAIPSVAAWALKRPYPASALPPAEALATWHKGDADAADFFPAVSGSGVHHQFTDESGVVTQTATGGVDTYILKKRAANMQVLYTCFSPRNPRGEGGVPSGAGWHSIGHELEGQPQDHWTFAETIVHSLDSAGIFAGWGVVTPYPYPEPAPFEAKDIVTFRILRPGEAFTTAKHHFHWYAIDVNRKACVMIWKHLGCPLRSDRELLCAAGAVRH